MSQLLMFAAAICFIILIFGILKRVILIALIIAALVALGALTVDYRSSAPSERSIVT